MLWFDCILTSALKVLNPDPENVSGLWSTQEVRTSICIFSFPQMLLALKQFPK